MVRPALRRSLYRLQPLWRRVHRLLGASDDVRSGTLQVMRTDMKTASLCALLLTSAACLQVSGDDVFGQTSGSPGATTGTGGQTTGSGSTSGGGPPTCPPCPANATCNPDGTCSCYTNYSECPGPEGGTICTQELLDSDNCGGCGNICPAGNSCLGGVCTCDLTTCPLRDGGTVCTDPESDPMNCSNCGIVCPLGEGCSLGMCD